MSKEVRPGSLITHRYLVRPLFKDAFWCAYAFLLRLLHTARADLQHLAAVRTTNGKVRSGPLLDLLVGVDGR